MAINVHNKIMPEPTHPVNKKVAPAEQKLEKKRSPLLQSLEALIDSKWFNVVMALITVR